ncbi:MAG: hypothetical protein DMF68_21345, partial [Acidobacteria bacterium]
NGTATITYHALDSGCGNQPNQPHQPCPNGGVDISSPDQTFTITVNAVNDAPVAANTSFTAQANMKIQGVSVPLASATDPDKTNGDLAYTSFDDGYTPTFTVNNITVGGSSPCTGATISNINTSTGTFDFDPAPGFTGQCTLNYTVNDSGNPAPAKTSAAATITVTVNGPIIWFVNPNAASNGVGTLSSPFKLLASATDVNHLGNLAANQRVFVYSGTTEANVGVSLTGVQTSTSPSINQTQARASAQWLIGQGVIGTSFDSVMGISPPNGTITRPTISNTASTANGLRPTIKGTVAVKENCFVSGFNIDVSAGSTKGLTNTASLSAGTSGSTVDVKDVNVTSAGGNAVDFSNAQTVNYATSDSTNSPNVLVSTTGSALSVVNTTIGASGMTFKSISAGTAASGPTTGIVLNNTGATAGLTVTGTGTTAGSGGTIQKSGQGATFTSTKNLSLKNMNFTNANSGNGTCNNVDDSTFNSGCQAGINMSSVTTATLDNLVMDNGTTGGQIGINGQTVSNLTISNSTVKNFGDAVQENILRFFNLTGTCSFTNSTFQKPGDAIADIRNNTGTLTLTIDNTTFTDTASSVAGSQGLDITSTSSATMTVNIGVTTGCNFTKILNAGYQVIAKQTSTINTNVVNSTFDQQTASVGRAVDISAQDTAQVNFNINHNTKLYGKGGSAVNIFGIKNAVLQGRIDNNTDVREGGIDSPGTAINVHPEDSSHGIIEISGNTITGIGSSSDYGINAFNHGDGASLHSPTTTTSPSSPARVAAPRTSTSRIFSPALITARAP